ncbi:hypothetical protein I3842_10G075900 [Carya illinoinensis]|uniref:Secreted protein n=1 Tax=Carya illinoinensis TaxID=32201 RepID=A0A922DVV5_CARIL|nr:hypothetical protein I3842_10G075900 [Carya illinoinensis]
MRAGRGISWALFFIFFLFFNASYLDENWCTTVLYTAHQIKCLLTCLCLKQNVNPLILKQTHPLKTSPLTQTHYFFPRLNNFSSS